MVASAAEVTGPAFGLGGRELASQSLKSWYDQAQDAKPKAKRAANAVRGPRGSVSGILEVAPARNGASLRLKPVVAQPMNSLLHNRDQTFMIKQS